MGELRAPLAQGQLDPIDDARLERIAARLRAEGFSPQPALRPRRLLVAAAGVLGVLLLVGALVARDDGDGHRAAPAGPVALAGGELPRALEAPASGRPLRLELSDGSRVELASGARLETLANGADALALRLDRGRATFDVAPGGPRRWTVDAGLARVEVVGTRFTVDRAATQVEVAVERGVVRVVGDLVPARSRELRRGASLVLVDPRPAPAAAALASAAAPSPAERPDASAETERDASERALPAPGSGWRQLALGGAYGQAFELLGAEGLGRETRSARSVDDLFLLADVARRSGHPADAVGPLERVIAEHAGDRRAAVAAFTLGRLHLDVLDQPAQADRAFSRALELGAPPALAEDAHALVVEARARLGDQAGAAAAAREYLGRYPEGRLADEVCRLARITRR